MAAVGAHRLGVCPTPATEQSQQGRERGQRQGDGQDDGDGCGDRHRGDEPHAERQQPEERDDDSEPGEQDGAAGGGDSAGGGLDRVEPEPGPQGAVLVDDEEGVVDPHGQAQHQPERRRGGGHLEVRGQRVGAAHPDEHADQGEQDGQAGQRERAEGQKQHDGGDGEADGLAPADGWLHRLKGAARGHREALPRDLSVDGGKQVVEAALGEIGDLLGELDGGDGDGAVVRDDDRPTLPVGGHQ